MRSAMLAGTSPARDVDTPAAVDTLVAALLDPERDYPIVALTSRKRERHPAIEAEAAHEIVRGADLVFLVDGPLTRRLSESLPHPKLGVFGGAARIWWPGLGAASSFDDHPLIFEPHAVYGSQAESRLSQGWRNSPPAPAAGVEDPELALLRRRYEDLEALSARRRDKLHIAEQEVLKLRERVGTAEQRARDLRPADVTPAVKTVVDPELAILTEVLTAWHEHFPPGRSDRVEYPFGRFRLLSGVMDDIAALQPPDRAKLSEVVAMVVCGRAPEVDGMRVHALRTGEGGSDPQRIRSRDGAKAMRAAVRRNTPDAVQLHYWICPDGTIDVASVRGHKYMDIPES